MKILVVTTRTDEEVLGVGGTLHRLGVEGHEITVAAVAMDGEPAHFDRPRAQIRGDAEVANELLGVRRVRFLDFSGAGSQALPTDELGAALAALVEEEEPSLVFLPFPGDGQEDHRLIFDASLVALRPQASRDYVERVLCYETLSDAHGSGVRGEPVFQPRLWIDVSKHLEAKIGALEATRSGGRPDAAICSPRAVTALAERRGNEVGLHGAEVFAAARLSWLAE